MNRVKCGLNGLVFGMKLDLSPQDWEQLNQRLEARTPQEILEWAWDSYGPNVAATSSFQSQSVPLLHMIAEVTPEMPVFFLDTGFHFPETLAFRDQLVKEWGLNVRVIKPDIGHDGFQRQYGDLYRTDPDMCCYINKVEPLRKARRELRGWISGIRRDQTEQRRDTPVIAPVSDGQVKICPMVRWTRRDVWQYISRHHLPTHPLMKEGYLSIGCAPCTRPVGEGEDERSGRWAGQNKTECGLHISLELETPESTQEQAEISDKER
jgi:phosphoadenosine phosphosulfate reductase